MPKKILKALSNNIGFKVLAFFLAFLLWIVVYNIDDPVKTRQFSISVSITNENSLANKNLCYEIMKNTNNVTFVVTAKRSILNSLDERNFKAVADLSSIVINQENMTGTVPVNLSCNGYNSSSVKIGNDEKHLLLKLENLMVKQFPVTATTRGTVAKGYALGEVNISSQNVLKVSGPESIVSTIASVVAVVDVEGMSQQISDNVVPTLLSESGKVIDTTRLSLSSSTVPVRVNIMNTKDVELNILVTGTPKENYLVTGVVSDPESVTVKGSSTALNAISKIDVSSDALNITGDRTTNIETTVDINEFLPEGVTLVDNEDAIVKVTISIEEYQTKTINLATDKITVKGLDSQYELEFLVDAINVKVSGMETKLSYLVQSDFKASVDASKLKEGVTEVQVDFGLDEAKYKAEPIKVSVSVTKKLVEKPDGSGNQDGNNTQTGSEPETQTGAEE